MSVEVPYDDGLAVKVVQTSHHQGSERHGNSRGIHSRGVLMDSFDGWTLLKRIALWKPADLVNAYLISISEIVSSCTSKGNGALSLYYSLVDTL